MNSNLQRVVSSLTILPVSLVLLGAAVGAAGQERRPAEMSHPSQHHEDGDTKNRSPAENPLSTIPLASLDAIRDRPLFSPTRRPPSLNRPPEEARPRPPVEVGPQLSLIGAIEGGSEDIAILVDARTKSLIRLKTGESYLGWVLRKVEGRQVVLENDQATTTLALPNSGGK